MPAATETAAAQSSLSEVWSSPLYRGATIAMFLSGLGTSAATPQIVLYLVKDLGTPVPIAGLYYLTSLVAPLAGYLIGSYSDRTGGRLGLFRLCALAGFVGWAGIALSTAAWMPFVITAVVLAFAGAATSQLFTAVHDDLHGRPGGEGIISIIRMALTAGWVVGPIVGAWLAAATSLRAMLWVTALCWLLQIAPLGTLRLPLRPKATAGAGSGPAPSRLRAMAPLLAFTGLYMLVYAGEAPKYGYLPLYMDEQLHLDPAIRGAVIGIQPLVELLLMPLSVILARRIGMLWLMCVGAAMGVAANLCFALWPSAAGMFAGQILMGGVWGIFAALGIIAAQRLLPGAVATASAIFISASPLTLALGGLLASVGVVTVGLPGLYFIPAVCALLAVIGLAAMARSGALKG